MTGDPIEESTCRLHGSDLRRLERFAEEERRNVSELLREAIGLLFESITAKPDAGQLGKA